MILIRNKAQCRKCGDIIESTYRHDFVWCECHTIFVDGGIDYLRRGGDFDDFIDLSEAIDETLDIIAEYDNSIMGTD